MAALTATKVVNHAEGLAAIRDTNPEISVTVLDFKTSEGTYSLAKLPTNSTAEFDWLGKKVKQAAIGIPTIVNHERAERSKEKTISVKIRTSLAPGDDAPRLEWQPLIFTFLRAEMLVHPMEDNVAALMTEQMRLQSTKML
jgi:hypothetical protein